jgi:hypothetical protein
VKFGVLDLPSVGWFAVGVGKNRGFLEDSWQHYLYLAANAACQIASAHTKIGSFRENAWTKTTCSRTPIMNLQKRVITEGVKSMLYIQDDSSTNSCSPITCKCKVPSQIRKQLMDKEIQGNKEMRSFQETSVNKKS